MRSEHKSRRRRRGFLEDYRIDDAYLLRPDRKTGRPGIYAGVNGEGDAVLVKVWPRQARANDTDLEEIWRHEVRQLHRLAGYPGALDHIAHLNQAGFDDQGFYLVFDPGQRRPLEALLSSAVPGHWITQPRQPANRARIWRNLRRIALALETLHAQGLLHRNLDTWAILTAAADEPDFQLTGFEWSMRIVGAHAAAMGSVRPRPTGAGQDSFLQDWLLFGLVAADLLSVDRQRLFSPRLTYSEVSDYVGVEEIRLLRTIVQLEPLPRIDGEVVASRIDEVLNILAAEIAGQEPQLHIVVRLGEGTLAERVRDRSGNDIEMDDVEAQLNFIRDDLSQSPMLLALRPPDGSDGFRLVVRGRHLHYRLREYVYPRSRTATWDFAYCDDVERNVPAASNILGSVVLEGSTIEILGTREAAERFGRLRGKLHSWESWRKTFVAELAPISPEERIYRAITLTQLLEALLAAADVFPVEVLSPVPAVEEGGSTLLVRPHRDPGREYLSQALGLRSPPIRLDYALSEERVQEEGWILTDSRSLGDRNPNDTDWQFERIERNTYGESTYVFSGIVPAPRLAEAFLIPGGSVGRDVQFRRRLKALQALRDHVELTRMIADPRRRILDSHDPLIEDEAFRLLDLPKQEALRELTATIPLYLVQGPPGVGKTRLVRDLVVKIRRTSPSEIAERLPKVPTSRVSSV
jgi:hypothetical protein